MYKGRPQEEKNYADKVCLYRILAHAPSLVIRMFLSSWYKEGTFHLGVYLLVLGREGEVRVPFLYLLFFKNL